ncbi:hypothetical protein SAMN05660297_02732 [Natronincola peptidivorans]|uniref:DUF3892 domain-containing protein n=1 Tax=Natronincola peptidivorans TaxID=426128 RepID=A0A1I0FAS7_9FIRM|nr:hypothetical protein [Natronincola peptidivorans]SET55138.1 hypothetical protein SAMN05660297_02732 [Natronincola peptidivorans]
MPSKKEPRLKVIKESPTGLNQKFLDTETNEVVNRGYVADNIDDYPGYHVMNKNKKRIIRSNPDGCKDNNLD